MTKNPIIHIHNFSKSFGGFRAVKNLDLEVFEGEIFGFLGRNGAGKTTTIRTMIGIYEADEGEVLLFGEKFHETLKDKIGYLPEERGLYTRARVKDMILYMARLKKMSAKEASYACQDLLSRFSFTEHSTKTIQNLSSGMQQKVQIINAIIHKPKLLILDEPFRGLDPINRQLVFEILKELKAQGTTILFSSHQIHEIENICDRVIFINAGESKAYGTIPQIKSSWSRFCIYLHFSGAITELPCGKLVKNDGNYAEILYEKEEEPQKILQFLLDHQIQIHKYELALPSLNQIFLELCQDEKQNLPPKDQMAALH